MVQPYAKNLLSRYTTKTTVLKTKMTLTLRRFVSCFLFKFLWRGSHLYFAASGQAVVKGVVPFSPPVLALNFVTQSFQQSHCASIFHRVLLTHFLALSLSQLVHNKTSLRIYTRMHSGGFEVTKLTYTRLEDNLIRHRRDRRALHSGRSFFQQEIMFFHEAKPRHNYQ